MSPRGIKKPSLEELVEGFKMCYRNALDLIDEASLLFENGKYARAISLTVLALEEYGKSMIVATKASLDLADDREWKVFWKRFRKHESKIGDFLLSSIAFDPESDITLKDSLEREYLEFRGANVAFLRILRELGFYVDFLGNRFILPNDFFKRYKKIVEHFLEVTKSQVHKLRFIYEGDVLAAFKAHRESLSSRDIKRTEHFLEDIAQFDEILEKVREELKKQSVRLGS